MGEQRERRIAAAVLAFIIAGAVYAGILAVMAQRLVLGVNRQQTGALLFAAVALAVLPVVAAVWLVAWRVARRMFRVTVVSMLLVIGGAALLARGDADARPVAQGERGQVQAEQQGQGQRQGQGQGQRRGQAQGTVDNLLLVVVDTMRGDRLGVAGYRPEGRSLTPRLDALAAEGAYFAEAWAQAPNTARSLPSILTSRHPDDVPVGDRFDNFPVTRDDAVTLFEALRAAGLRTLLFASHYYFQVNRGIRQGFAEVDNRGALSMEDNADDSAAPRIVPRAAAALAALGRDRARFAMMVHLFEPHSEYQRHAGSWCPRGSRMSDRYDCELAFADRWVGELVDAVDTAGLRERTLVVVTSDHGEAFGDHRSDGLQSWHHGRTLYREVLHVPLLVRLPGAAPARIDGPVALLDLAPTIADALGIAAPAEFQGGSQLAAVRGGPRVPRPVFAELLPAPYWDHRAGSLLTADGRHHVIQRVAPERRLEIYDLVADRGETTDLAGRDPDLTAGLRAGLLDFMER